MSPLRLRLVTSFLAAVPAASLLSGCASSRAPGTAPAPGVVAAVSADDALQRLVEGNARFAANERTRQDRDSPNEPAARRELAKGQHPFAIVLACSDSRVAPEFVFDQDLGDLFVIRVAGNTADDVALGSIEYAVEHLGARLVVVMGHESCGAVGAAVSHAERGESLPGHLPAVIQEITPVVRQGIADGGDVVHNCVWHNAAKVAAKVRTTGPIIPAAIGQGHVRVCAAVYDLESGVVRFLPQPRMESGQGAERLPDMPAGVVHGATTRSDPDNDSTEHGTNPRH